MLAVTSNGARRKMGAINFLFYAIHIQTFFFFFFLSMVTPMAYGCSWAGDQIGDQIGAVVDTIPSHSDTRSEPHLQPTLQLVATLDP